MTAQGRVRQIETYPLDVNGAAIAAGRESPSRGEDSRCAMTVVIAEIVDRVIDHARRMLDEGAYDWPTSRAALARILADLQARSDNDPSLRRLRRFIALGDRAWREHGGNSK